jgi:DHA1 family tetracycline resistance protein-like MFS transporter
MSLAERRPLGRLLPLYVVVFMGFVGYSLMITVFTPMLLRGDRAMLPPGSSTSLRTIMLDVLLCLYPLGQLIGSPILGSLSDRFGRRPILLVSLTVTTACYVLISLAITTNNLALLGVASLAAGFAEANIVTAQSAIADLVAPAPRNRYFGYIYMALSLAYIAGPLGRGKLTDPHLVAWFSDATPFWAVCPARSDHARGALPLPRDEGARPGRGQPGESPPAWSRPSPIRASAILSRQFPALSRDLRLLPLLPHVSRGRVPPRCLRHVGICRLGRRAHRAGQSLADGIPLQPVQHQGPHHLVGGAHGVFMIAVILPKGQPPLWPLLFMTGAALAVCLPSCATLLSNAADPAGQGRAMGNNQAIQVGAEALSGLAAGLLAALSSSCR